MSRVWAGSGEKLPLWAYSGRECRDPAGPGGASEPRGEEDAHW